MEAHTYPVWATCPRFHGSGFSQLSLVPSSTQVNHVHYLHQCSMLLNLLSLLQSMFYKVFLCPWNHIFLSQCICLSIYHLFPHVHTILDDLTSALIPKVQDSIAHTLLTGSRSLHILSLAPGVTLLLRYTKGVALLLYVETNIR